MSLQKPQSRATEKRLKASAKETHKRDVYRRVSERDGYKCRCCGKPVKKGGGLLYGGHHHEIRFKSLGGPIETWNVVLLNNEHHKDAQANRLFIQGDADRKLRFERSGVVWFS